MAKYLDKDGLSYLWNKIKGWVNSHEHPVGSVYITISSNFNPADQWGGTWAKIAEGQCLIQSGSTYTLGSTGGEAYHYLTGNEMPPHGHSAGKVYNYKLSNYGLKADAWEKNGDQVLYIDQTSASSSTASNILHTNAEGGGASHNNMQPYLAVNIWKRTA